MCKGVKKRLKYLSNTIWVRGLKHTVHGPYIACKGILCSLLQSESPSEKCIKLHTV